MLIHLKLRNTEMILTYFWSFFLKKICKSVFKQDKYNFTKKIEFGYFHAEKLYMSQKMANPLCPFLKRINLFEYSPTIPTHNSTPPWIVFKWAFRKQVLIIKLIFSGTFTRAAPLSGWLSLIKHIEYVHYKAGVPLRAKTMPCSE